ncbi:MAG: ORF6N domain-containing protein, partial [Ruminococcus sp.]|nr:ORF6N domain-containing protein [Ruminococcus sp.]
FEEVLPEIRRHGTYSVATVRISPDFPIQFATISYDGNKVLTTSQLAQAYGTTNKSISQNFNRHRNRFIEGTHFYRLTGKELRNFKNNPKNVGIVSRQTSILYVWTEAGSLLHAKNLSTDKAYEVYEYLLGKYFSTPKTVPPYNDLLRKFDELSSRLGKLESNSDTKRLMTVHGRSPDWRKATHSLINRIAIATDSEIRDIYLDIYEEIEFRAGVNLSRRLENLRDRMYERGIPENRIHRLNNVDVIADDKKLTEIYIAVVKEMAVKDNVSGNGVSI